MEDSGLRAEELCRVFLIAFGLILHDVPEGLARLAQRRLDMTPSQPVFGQGGVAATRRSRSSMKSGVTG